MKRLGFVFGFLGLLVLMLVLMVFMVILYLPGLLVKAGLNRLQVAMKSLGEML